MFLLNASILIDFSIQMVQRPLKSIDLTNAVILVSVLFEKTHLWSQNLLECWIFHVFNDFLIFATPRAPSKSNHYVHKVGGYLIILICTLNPPNASP